MALDFPSSPTLNQVYIYNNKTWIFDGISWVSITTNSINLTGTPTATTASVGTNTTQIATTAFVNAEIANDAALKSTEQSKTLAAASWTGASAPYSYSLSVTGVTTTSNQEILLTTDVTQTQLDAYQAANIQDGGQTTDTLTLKAWGTKPTVDIPIRVILRKDK